MKKVLVILAALSLLLLSSCSTKQAKLKEDTWEKLSFMSESIGNMISDCDFAFRSKDYDAMEEELGIIQEQLANIKDTVDILADRYADRDYN